MQEFDLKAAVEALRDDPRYSRLGKEVENARSAWSIGHDLNEAQQYTETAEALVERGRELAGPEQRWDRDPTIARSVSALTKAALLAYFRAHDGGAQGRNGGPILNTYKSKKLLDAHRRLLNVRHTSIAHHGREDSETWHREGIILCTEAKRAVVMYPWVRWGSREHIVIDLKTCLPVALEAVEAWSQQTRARLEETIRKLAGKNLLSPLYDHRFNIAAFLSGSGADVTLAPDPNDWFKLPKPI